MNPSYLSLLDSPIAVKIEVTGRCNSNCVFCYNPWKRPGSLPKEMSLKGIKEMLDDLSEAKIMVVNITGGEPFLRKDIFEILEYCKEKGFIVFISSNGREITKKESKKIKKLGIDGVSISLHGTKEIHEKITQVSNSFDEGIRGIKALLKEGIGTKINFVVNKLNYKNLDEVFQLAQNLGIHSISIGRLVPRNDKLKSLELEPKNWRYFLNKMDQLIKKTGIPTKVMTAIPLCFTQSSHVKHRCLAGYTWLVIGPEGNVKICGHSSQSIGNIKEKSIQELWKIKEKFLPNLCENCNYFPRKCTGGCWVVANVYSMDKDPLFYHSISLSGSTVKFPEEWFDINQFEREFPVKGRIKDFKEVRLKGDTKLREEKFGGVLYRKSGFFLNKEGFKVAKLIKTWKSKEKLIKHWNKKALEDFLSILNKLNVLEVEK